MKRMSLRGGERRIYIYISPFHIAPYYVSATRSHENVACT
jgi:hypothetical protein